MTINVQSLVEVLRYPMLNDIARKVLEANGFDPQYKEKDLRDLGAVYLVKKEEGIALDFATRRAFEADYAPARAEGDAIFACMFLYPKGSKSYGKFTAPIGFGIDGCTTRQDALGRLGESESMSEDDGIVEWDRWIVGEFLSIRAEYDDDGNIRMWTIGVPMKFD